MKKTLLFASILLGSMLTANAQTTVWSEDFNNEDITRDDLIADGWTFFDLDGDGFQWGDIFNISSGGAPLLTTPAIISRSWQQGALTPDNWFFTPAIDLTNASGAITLNWKANAAAFAWHEEKYSVYAGLSPVPMDYMSGTSVSFTEVFPSDSGDWLDRTLDLSSFAGQTIYVVFRHWDCTDQDWLGIDDIVVTAEGFASIDNHLTSSFSVYPNPVNDVLRISNTIGADILSVTITDLNGRTVKEFGAISEINVSDLNAGVYFANINSTEGRLTKKIVKQ